MKLLILPLFFLFILGCSLTQTTPSHYTVTKTWHDSLQSNQWEGKNVAEYLNGDIVSATITTSTEGVIGQKDCSATYKKDNTLCWTAKCKGFYYNKTTKIPFEDITQWDCKESTPKIYEEWSLETYEDILTFVPDDCTNCFEDSILTQFSSKKRNQLTWIITVLP